MNVNLRFLFDNLNGVVGTLHLTRHTNEANIRIYNNRFALYNLEDFNGTNVNAGSTSVTFIHINLDLNRENTPD